jgi:acylphosphatase
VISGRVQGVAFRQSAVDEARSLGLDGWVRNLPDGRVEALAEGARPRVESLVAWCRRGPRLARVDGVEVTWEEPRGDLRAFDITW